MVTRRATLALHVRLACSAPAHSLNRVARARVRVYDRVRPRKHNPRYSMLVVGAGDKFSESKVMEGRSLENDPKSARIDAHLALES